MTGSRGGVPGGGYELTGRGFIGGRDQHADPLVLQRRILSSGIVGRYECSQIVLAQHADDQFRLGAAGNDRYRNSHALEAARNEQMLESGLL